jgi:hypothetical protein
MASLRTRGRLWCLFHAQKFSTCYFVLRDGFRVHYRITFMGIIVDLIPSLLARRQHRGCRAMHSFLDYICVKHAAGIGAHGEALLLQ